MDKEYLKLKLEDLEYPSGKSFGRRKDLQDLKKEIEFETSWLPLEIKTTFRIFCILNEIRDFPVCRNCGKGHTKINQNDRAGNTLYDTYKFSMYCSQKCAKSSPEVSKKRMNRIVERYGDHNMKTTKGRDEYNKAILKKYGVDNVMKIPEIKEASLKTESGDWRITSKSFISKSKKTKLERYGGHHMNDLTIKNKVTESRKKNMLERFGVIHESKLLKNPDRLEIFEDDEKFKELCNELVYSKEIADFLGYTVNPINKRMKELGINKPTNRSQGEDEIFNFLISIVGEHEVESSKRGIIKNKELDIFVPSKNIAIEFNGLYWHSERFKDIRYHQNKSLECKSKDIQLIHVWQDQWECPIKREIIKNKIKHKINGSEIKIAARKCEVFTPSLKERRDFFANNHIQGFVGSTECFGLKSKDSGEYVAMMSFKKLGSGVWDLSRFATSLSVVGGFSKLLKHFKRNFSYSNIITFAHLDYSHGGVYEKNGFEYVETTKPNYRYYRSDGTVLSRQQAMKHKLPVLLENFNPELTEHVNMLNHGFFRIFDAGSIKYQMKN